jgi:hypothetical protein
MANTIKVRFYLCGVYQGIREIDAGSICGHLIQGNLAGATPQLGEMVDELNAIPAMRASADMAVGQQGQDESRE